MSMPQANPSTHTQRDVTDQRRTARGRDTRRVAVVSAVVNLLLAGLQVVIGLIANSAALVADGIHTTSDLLSDVLVWFAARHASLAPDEDHPYGHGRFETAATLGLGILLALVGLGIVWAGAERMLESDRPPPGQLAIAVAAFGILAKEALYWYTMAAARRLKSDMLRANAWHHRSDAISSVVVLVGVAGAVLGFSYLDALAAVVVGLMVARIGWDLGWRALTELVDTALDED
ncbi:MAG: cation transporter, partial [Gammaproteobacteria bacterium]|nr:cation transporter [Gammaproteobacteria bacterium]